MRARDAVAAVVLATALVAAVAAPSFGASEGGSVGETGSDAGGGINDEGNGEVVVSTPGTPGTPGGGGGGFTSDNGYSCTWYPIGDDGRPIELQPYDPPPPDGTYAWLRCSGPEAVDAPRTRASGGTAAAIAVEDLPLPNPDVATNPDAGNDQLVGVPTWLWVKNWQPLSVTAAVPGTTAELVATPRSMRYEMGDGEAPLVCPGAGTAYDSSLSADDQSSDCTYTYERSSARQPGNTYTVTATVTWGLSWTSTTGQSGTLPDLERSSTFSLRVAEAQALVVR